MIYIGFPKLSMQNDLARLCAVIEEDGVPRELYFETDADNADSLLGDRADAFVVAALPHAMICKQDIVSAAPVSQELLYQLSEYYIPTLSRSTERFHAISVTAPPAPPRKPAAGVATGFSGGVDSLYTMLAHKDRSDSFRLTHLAVFNAGAFEGSDAERLYLETLDRVRSFADENRLACIGLDTNIHKLFPQEMYLSVVSLRLIACAMALGGLLGTFLLSSSYEYSSFAIDETNNSLYDLFNVELFSASHLQFYSAGGAVRRIDKLRLIAAAPEAMRGMLHVCVHSVLPGTPNCGICPKCVRTELALESLGALDSFDGVFPLEIFNARHIELSAKAAASGNLHALEALAALDPPLTPEFSRRMRQVAAAQKIVKCHRKELLERIGGAKNVGGET